MPQVAADSAGLLERLVYGFDGSVYRVVKVDTDGNLVLALVAGSTIEVTQADPAVRGNTKNAPSKNAVLENGLKIQVPIFIKSGDEIVVDTRTGEYVERAK